MIKLWRGSEPFSDTEPASTLPMILPDEESAYADTAPPTDVEAVAPAPPAAMAPAEVTLDDLVHEIRRDGRACPLPMRWLAFYRLLEEHAGARPLPPPPLVGSAWAATPSLDKRVCFRQQVEWAAANHCTLAAYQFLKELKKGDWHYLG